MSDSLSEVASPWFTQGEHGGLWPLSKHSNAYAASLVVKSGPGKLYGFTVYNSGAAQFVLLFDTAGVPAEGAIPCAIFAVATLTTLPIFYGNTGRAFNTGCVLVNSSTGPTKTIGAADCFFDAQYLQMPWGAPTPGASGGGAVPYVSGAGSPVGTVTPTANKPLYIDTTNGAIYLAYGARDTHWVVLGVVPGNVGEAAGFVLWDALNRNAFVMAGDRDDATVHRTAYFGDTYSQWTGHQQGLLWSAGPGEGNEQLLLRTGTTGQHVGTLQDASGVLTSPGGIKFPTADPHVAGAWWDNAGVLTKSAG